MATIQPDNRGEPRKGPISIASANGLGAVALAVEKMRAGADPVDAVVAGVNLVENDPNDHSVGYGGIPNEEGIVELDASVMHGPTGKCGAVAALRNIKNAASVALVVLRRTDHVLIVGEGALRFARAHGFQEENLLTPEARAIWLKWKETLSAHDDWLSDDEQRHQFFPETQESDPGTVQRGQDMTPDGADRARFARFGPHETPHGTINCLALDEQGNLGGTTTTSGLAFKIPGRVGDSPIIGAGLFVDNEVGAAGSTGRGEANLQNCSSVLIVEQMRAGRTPEEACLAVLKRIADRCEQRLRDKQGRPAFDLSFYALTKDGRVGGAVMRGIGTMAFHNGREARHIELPGLFPAPPKKKRE